jgi:hypothetical protein
MGSGAGTARVHATDTAGQRPAQITIASVWENSARIAPDISGVGPRHLPQEFIETPHTSDILEGMVFRRLGIDSLVPNFESTIAEHMQADGQPGTGPNDRITEIPRDRLEAALVAVATLADGNQIEISAAPGAYKVLSGDDVRVVRDLPSVIIGFEPPPGTGIYALEQVGKQISTILRQESALVPPSDTAVMQALQKAFGGAT